MADVGYLAIVVASLGAYWWRHLRPARQPRLAVGDLFAADAEIALHVGSHEAMSRRQGVSSLHVLYGLLQDDAVIAAITASGGNPDAVEDRVLAALDALAGDDPEDAGALLGRVAAQAHHIGRQASCTDLWAGLRGSRAGRLLDDAGIERGAALFALCHGTEPDITLADQRDVFVVLRNDHYTTQQFVCHVLRELFALPDPQAEAIMLATHTTGRAVIGRFAAADARLKIAAARALARAQGFPLWIGVEPT